MAENMVWSNDSLHWNQRFVRVVHYWNWNPLVLKCSAKFVRGGDDKIIWIPTKSHGFELKIIWHQGWGWQYIGKIYERLKLVIFLCGQKSLQRTI